MLLRKVIKPAQTVWASLTVFAPKKVGPLYFCADYKNLNAVTVCDSFPLHRMKNCIGFLGDEAVPSTLDAGRGYWQVKVEETDRDKMAFTSHNGLYRIPQMSFDLKNAPETIQRAMDVILLLVKWQLALVYIDNIVVFSRSQRDLIEHVRRLLSLLRNAGDTLNLENVAFSLARLTISATLYDHVD